MSLTDSSNDSNSSQSDSTQSNNNSSSDEQTTPQETKKKSNRGRKPLPEDQKRKGCRYIHCPNCDYVMDYWFGKPEFRKPRVVEKEMSKTEKSRIYNQRYKEKKALAKQNTLDG